MNLNPKSKALRKHIQHYWVVSNTNRLFLSTSKVYGYPGIRPEIILILKGYLKYTYLGKQYETNKSILASHISGQFLFDSSQLEQFAIIQFKPRSLSALLPFTRFSSKQLMHHSLCDLAEVFGEDFHQLENNLRQHELKDYVDILDAYLLKKLNANYSGFLIEMLGDLPFTKEIPILLKKTGYSLSSLERYVKKETGLTPKNFLVLRKYKAGVEEMYTE